MVKTRSAAQKAVTESEVTCVEKTSRPQSVGQKSLNSKHSSVAARKIQLEYEVAQQKARIQMELLDKRLAADIAALDDSSQSEATHLSQCTRGDIERWMDRSQHEQQNQQAHDMETKQDLLNPEKVYSGPDGTVQQLAAALQQLVTSTVTNNQNQNLLSRLSTSKDLPIFSGDPMDYLQFVQAYEESNELCKFNDKEKMWRLRKCLRGAAREAVSSLLITPSSPEKVMETLKLLFGNSDIILMKIISELKRLPALPLEYHKEITKFSIKVSNYVTAVQALDKGEYLQGVNVTTIVLSKMPTVLISKWNDYCYSYENKDKTSKLCMLAEFLHEEAVKLSQSGANLLYLSASRLEKKYHTSSEAVLVQMDEESCKFCKLSAHKLTDCKKFKRALRKDRWQHVKRHGLCYKCLVAHHDRATCPAPACNAEGCGQSHHRWLHYIPRQNQNSTVTEPGPAPVSSVSNMESVTHIDMDVSRDKCAVLLKVVPVYIHCTNGQIVSTVALLDDGSSISLISAELAARAGLRGRQECLRVRGAWNGTSLVCDSLIVNVSVSCKFESNKQSEIFNFNARSVDNLDLPVQNVVNCNNYSHLMNIKNRLPLGQLKPEILIGQDNCHLLRPLEYVVGAVSEPCATRTPLGWCLHGRAAAIGKQVQHSSFLISVDSEENELRVLHDQVGHFFSIESLGISSKPRQNVEDLRALEILEQTSTLKDNKWYIGLPWKDENCKMPDTFSMAVSRLRSVEQKMKKNEDFAKRYRERIHHLFENEYARQLSSEAVGAAEKNSKTWYLPHFGVDNPNKKKLRLVFDAAAQTNGLSLNDYLLKGPDLLQSLFGIMLKFRENRVGITGDIKDMFLRVKIRPEDQDAFRFLFRDTDGSLKTNVMTSLIFGANCSPFIAQYVKNKNAERFKKDMPRATQAIEHSHYMDDYIDSLEEEAAIELVRDITYIHSQGNFHIRNWTSNSKVILSSIPEEDLGETAKIFTSGQETHSNGERILGLIWEPLEDLLKLDISFKRIPPSLVNGTDKPTKRQMLQIVMSIFDIYGILAPVTITGKIILQECWKTNTGWDEQVSDDLHKKWHKWLQVLGTLSDVGLPRYYGMAAMSNTEMEANHQFTYSCLQLHMFCDASSTAMSAVAYWRWKERDDNWFVAFIASKSRVAKLKATTIPRLELQAGVLAARLADTIVREHRIKPQRKYFWSDSTTVLYWIKNNSKNYKTFVANRLGEIDELTKSDEWRYVPTKMNIADMATRENYDVSTLRSEWLSGPTFLRGSKDDWPKDVTQPEVDTSQLECVCAVTLDTTEFSVPDPTRFSSWLRLVRATLTILKFIEKLKKIRTSDDLGLMANAERILLRYSQARTFGEEIWKIKHGHPLARSSKLLTLTPYLDSLGILRVGGRIDAAIDVAPEVKKPIILDGGDYISRLIVRAYHVNAAHGNQELVVNELKQRYWIIKLRPTVRNVVSKCMMCRIRRCKPEIPRMGSLPEARMAHHQRAFSFCGVDLFGPLEVTAGRSRLKRYGVLFTCMTVRAIHIELVASLTTDSFIMALRRMASRRGWPQQLFSDNGTNLRGADEELKRSIAQLDQAALEGEALNRGVKWTFIPPASPHWGGAWERLIRSVKTSLKVILKERAPKEETLTTLLAEVENMVNSRPLTHVSVDPGSSEALTPNHLLIGSSSNLPQLGVFDDRDILLRKQWRVSQRLADMFWHRWVREVLPEMVPRTKWLTEQRPLQVGDLVLIADPNSPRNTWPRGLVMEVFPGKDGRVRMVKINTQAGTLTRSTTRVLRIPIGNECC